MEHEIWGNGCNRFPILFFYSHYTNTMEKILKEINKEIDKYLALKESEKKDIQRHYYIGILEGLYKAKEIIENN